MFLLDVVMDARHSTDLPHTLPVRPDLPPLRGSGLTWSVTLWIVFPDFPLVRRRFLLIYPQAISVVVGHDKAPTVALRWGCTASTVGAVAMRAMVGVVAEDRPHGSLA